MVELSNLSEAARKSEENSDNTPLAERLNQYPSREVDLQSLVQWPPKLEPVPVKPLFFDAAWNYIEYPGREAKQVATNGTREEKREEAAQPMQQQKKGWFGFGR